MSTEFSIRWKGALYGIDYENWPSTYTSLYHSDETLRELCCEMLVEDATFTRNAVETLPRDLHYSLMQAAITSTRLSAMKVLMEAWQYRSLSVSDLSPRHHQSGHMLYDRLLFLQQLENAIRLTSGLIHSFVYLAQLPSSRQHLSCLKILDLTGFPVVEPVLQLLSQNIAKGNFQLNCPFKHLNESVELRSGKRLCLTPKECSCTPYVIRMDCFMRDDCILDEFCRALTMCRFSPSHLKLEIVKIDVICLGKKNIAQLLTLLETEDITGMGFEYNSIGNSGLVYLSPQISTFVNVSALDLSCNNLKFSENSQVCSAMGKILQNLTKLRRLDLSNNKLSRSLSSLFSHIPKNRTDGFEYLKLSACQLKNEDMEYLARCPWLKGLKELDLSENVLASRNQELIHLLENVKSSLRVLELEDCGFTGEQLPSLLRSIGLSTGLRYVNIARNHLTVDDLCQGLPSLNRLPLLKCIRLACNCNWLDHLYPAQCEVKSKLEQAMQEGSTVVKQTPISLVWDNQHLYY